MSQLSRPSNFEESLRNLRKPAAATGNAWARFAQLTLRVTEGLETLLFIRGTGGESPLRPVAQARRKAVPETTVLGAFEEFARLAEQHGSAAGVEANGGGQCFVATRLGESSEARTLAVVRLGAVAEGHRAAALERLELAAATWAVEQIAGQVVQAREETEVFASILDLMMMLEDESRYGAAAMLLCHQLATQFTAQRVSLGFVHGHDIRVEAISHAERFERKSAAVKSLAMAMEEALDQQEEIVFPGPSDQAAVARCHELYALEQAIPYLASIPMRQGEQDLGVMTLERENAPFSLAELRRLRLTANHAGRRLHDLRERDRWWGARLAAHWRRQASRWLGPEHTGLKLTAVGLAALLTFLSLYQRTYRVESPFTLRSDRLSFVPAPFDGYVDEVLFRLGDSAEEGQVLVSLNARELSLDESAAVAEQNSFLAEAQKAQSADQIAEMQIALAKAQEAKARLERTRYHLSQAQVKAPFAGIVVEGDLRERVGAPVKQGEVLFKLARLTDLYVDAQVNERSVDRIAPNAHGEIAFTSQPKWKFPVHVERVEPAANASEKGNNFAVRLTLEATPESWWRPGMTGLCKVDAGRHSLLWILTHRTVEFLRLYLWW